MAESTGVARYLEKKTLSNNEVARTTATGVERYLARQASFNEDTVEALTGVAKYLRDIG